MDEDDPFDSSIIVSQRVDLDDDEKDHIRELLPPKDEYIGLAYVTRLMRTNLVRYQMVRMAPMLFVFLHNLCLQRVPLYDLLLFVFHPHI